MEKIGEKIKILRTKFGLTQKEVADALEIERSTYTYYELGKTTPSWNAIKKLAQIFQIAPYDLLEEHNLSHMLLNRAYEKCFHNNEYKTMTERELRYISYTASYISLVLAWHKGGMRQSIESVAKILKDMFGIN